MEISTKECANLIIQKSKPVININGFKNNEWYRKPKGQGKALGYKGILK